MLILKRGKNVNSNRGQGEGSIYQRFNHGKSVWVAALTIPGKRYPKTFVRKTRKEAAEKLAEAQHQISTGLSLLDGKLTVGQYLDHWLKEVVVHSSNSPKTKTGYESHVRIWLKPELGHIKLNQLSITPIRSLLAKMKAAGKSPRTRQSTHAVLRIALGDAEREGLVHRNTAKLVTVSASPSEAPSPREPYTVDELEKFLAAAKCHRLEALFVLAVTTGLREGEMLGLTWKDVVIDTADENQALISRSLKEYGAKKRGDFLWYFEGVKTKRSMRTIGLPDIAAKALRAHRERQAVEYNAAGKKLWISGASLGLPDDLIFSTPIGSPIHSYDVSKLFRKLQASAGLREVGQKQRPHDLRHAAASYWAHSGESLHSIMGYLGHSSISITANLYTHLMPGESKKAARKMDSYLDGIIKDESDALEEAPLAIN
jgi:integrase